ncbi:MAG: hypothetical protein KF696_03305 [Planctomycetes bacterium]|nr:hypothetical protein [Planctomycetota bacterium]MCW8135033.1 hypothetical protein [Planctomycetota bacterium]
MRYALLLAPLLLLAACGNPKESKSDFTKGTDPLAIEFWTLKLPDAVVGEYYQTYITITGGNGPYTWSVVGGVMPYGLNWQFTNTSTRQLAGTPTMANTFTFRVRVDDSRGRSHEGNFTINVITQQQAVLPAAGPVIFVIDASAESALAGGGFTSQLDAEKAKWTELAQQLSSSNSIEVVRIGGSMEYSYLFGSAQAADSANLAAANANIAALTSSGMPAMYSALKRAITQYGAGVRIVMLGGARPGNDSGAPAGYGGWQQILADVDDWLSLSPGTRIDCHLFGTNSEVELLYQNLTLRTGGAWYWHP